MYLHMHVNGTLYLTQCPYGAGLLGCLGLLRPGPRYVSRHPRTAEILWRQGRGLRGSRRDLHRRRPSTCLRNIWNLIGARWRTSGGNQDGLPDRGGGPVPQAREGGEERPRGGVVGRGTCGGGTAG